MLEQLEPRLLMAAFPGDYTGDWQVDLDDFVVVKQNWGDTTDLADFNILKSAFSTSVFDVPIKADPATPYTYEHFDGPLFDTIEYQDVQQGNIGDCYFLAALAAFAHAAPEVIEDAIAEIGDGTYWVRYYAWDGTATYSRIDADLPVRDGHLAYATNDDDLWVQLLEKAFADRYGSNDYQALDLGWPREVYAALTGREGEVVYDFSALDGPVALITRLEAPDLVANHVYTLISSSDTHLTLYNPWGTEVVISIAQAETNFRWAVIDAA